MQSIQVAELKSHFSDILKSIKNEGEQFIIEYGKQHEKIAMLIPYNKNLEIKAQREFGAYKGRGGFSLKDNFAITNEELLGL